MSFACIEYEKALLFFLFLNLAVGGTCHGQKEYTLLFYILLFFLSVFSWFYKRTHVHMYTKRLWGIQKCQFYFIFDCGKKEEKEQDILQQPIFMNRKSFCFFGVDGGKKVGVFATKRIFLFSKLVRLPKQGHKQIYKHSFFFYFIKNTKIDQGSKAKQGRVGFVPLGLFFFWNQSRHSLLDAILR